MPPYLLSVDAFSEFLRRFSAGEIPRAEWNHAAHLTVAAVTIHNGGTAETVRERILTYNKTQGIESTPDSGYHETVTRFWVDRICELTAGLGRGATAWDAARAAVAAFAHRGRLFDTYYSYNIVASREARAAYRAPDLSDARVIRYGHEH
ncbi:MAG: hypothetical protein HYX27_13705 [Acidobacteria bacterium]|nr:hypothetical protein [Acidobacteriota bacterium]